MWSMLNHIRSMSPFLLIAAIVTGCSAAHPSTSTTSNVGSGLRIVPAVENAPADQKGPNAVYDRKIINAISSRWYEQLARGATPRKYLPTGEVAIKFNLHFDGQMSDVSVLSTAVNGPFTTNCCRAMSDSAPYPA